MDETHGMVPIWDTLCIASSVLRGSLYSDSHRSCPTGLKPELQTPWLGTPVQGTIQGYEQGKAGAPHPV